jgi:hypothetical protein
LHVSGGDGNVYTWQYRQDVPSCAHCPNGICTPPFCNEIIITYWNNYTIGDTMPIPPGFPVRVTDGHGNYVYFNTSGSIDSLPPCIVSIQQIAAYEFGIIIVPNPSDGNQHLVIISGIPGPVKIFVTDITGRRIGYFETTIANGRNEIHVNDFFTQKSPGYYYLTVENGNFKKTIGLLQ